ncbi:MAG TPA: protein kinase, partial [Nannocystaceae bacterium]|nr:protein kinase [Nannocystaceae bacterium]
MDREPHAPAAARGAGDLGARYDILGRLAVGGMAELFLARPKGSAHVVVVKRILPQLAEDPEFVRMFRDEAHLASTLQHPNIARVFDFGLDGEEPFFAMEYVHGENLRTILRGAIAKCEPIPLALVLTIADGLTAALHHAHEQTDGDGRPLLIVHRDVSPTNVLVSQRGELKIVDFGIAKAAAGTHVTQAGMLKGKASYMSPEQCRAEPVDRRSDIFAIGILLYELTTLQRLFKGDNELAILHQILTGQITRPSTVTNNYPPELEAILLRTLQIEPSQRYPTAAALRGDLRTFAHRHGLTISGEALSRYLVERFGAKPYPGGEPSTVAREEEAPTTMGARDEAAVPANARPASRTPTGTNAAAKPGNAGLRPAPRPKAATPGLVARKSGPTGSAARAPISARPTESSSAPRTATPSVIVGGSSSAAATSAPPRPSSPTSRPPSDAASPRSPGRGGPSSASSESMRAREASTAAPTSTRAAPTGPRPSSTTAPAGPRPSSSTAPAGPRPSSTTAPAGPRPAMPLPQSARPTAGVPIGPPQNGASAPLSAESAAFLRGEVQGAEFSAGAHDGRPGGTQIAPPAPAFGPPPGPAAATLPGTPSGVDRTTIAAIDGPARTDRTMIAMPDGTPTHSVKDATVPMDVGPRARPRDATMILPDHDARPRPPGGVDRTVIVSSEDAPPSRGAPAGPMSWSVPPVGETQPVAIDPSSSA